MELKDFDDVVLASICNICEEYVDGIPICPIDGPCPFAKICIEVEPKDWRKVLGKDD